MKLDYPLSEKAFIDTWTEFGRPTEIKDCEKIHEFFQLLIENTKGKFIVDHITAGNYDCVHSIEYAEPYTIIKWHDFNNYRLKNLNKKLNEFDGLTWYAVGCATYDYILTKIHKIKFIEKGNHLYIGVLSRLTNLHEYNKWLEKNNYSVINIDDSNEFEIEYSFWEGEPSQQKKHVCRVNCLPFYTNLIQPKENACSSYHSKAILIIYSYEEIEKRLNEANSLLAETNPEDEDSLQDIGNRIRRILEYSLKYYCACKNISLDLTDKYEHILLGKLRNKVNGTFSDKEYSVSQSIVNKANEFSHDSGIIVQKQDVEVFCNEAIELINKIYTDILSEYKK